MASAATKAPKTPKKQSDGTGTPKPRNLANSSGENVTLDDNGAVVFSSGRLRSAYDPQLLELQKQTNAKVAEGQLELAGRTARRFADPRTKNSILGRAKELKMKIQCSLGPDGALYVRIDPSEYTESEN